MEILGYPNMPTEVIRVLMSLEPLDFDDLKTAMETLTGDRVVEEMLAEVLSDMRNRGIITHGGNFTNIRRALG